MSFLLHSVLKERRLVQGVEEGAPPCNEPADSLGCKNKTVVKQEQAPKKRGVRSVASACSFRSVASAEQLETSAAGSGVRSMAAAAWPAWRAELQPLLLQQALRAAQSGAMRTAC